MYIEYQSVCPFLEIWSPIPSPSSKCTCVSPIGPKGGRSNTPLRVRGWGPPSWGDPIRTTAKKACHSVYYVLPPQYSIPPPFSTSISSFRNMSIQIFLVTFWDDSLLSFSMHMGFVNICYWGRFSVNFNTTWQAYCLNYLVTWIQPQYTRIVYVWMAGQGI